ncbi:MAG TPA: peptidoglycan editing factor PgeF [Caulobacteraceae bacterium]
MSDLPTIQSPLLSKVAGLRHAFFTRRGGVSTGVYDSLNVGRGSRDEPADVAENRRRAADWFGLMPDALNTCYQIHSAQAVFAEAPWGPYRPQADAIVTNWPSLAVGALAADCAPVLFVDPDAHLVAAAHAGWQGALGGVVEATLELMKRHGGDPSRIVAAVGPCIGPNSYEVGPEFFERFTTQQPGAERFFRPAEADGKHMFDLPAFVLDRLERGGVAEAEWVGRDTCAEEDLFFSNRRANHRGESDYGRLLSAIMIE